MFVWVYGRSHFNTSYCICTQCTICIVHGVTYYRVVNGLLQPFNPFFAIKFGFRWYRMCLSHLHLSVATLADTHHTIMRLPSNATKNTHVLKTSSPVRRRCRSPMCNKVKLPLAATYAVAAVASLTLQCRQTPSSPAVLPHSCTCTRTHQQPCPDHTYLSHV